MRVLFDKRVGVLNGNRQTGAVHHRQIDQIIAGVGGLVSAQVQLRQQILERRQFVVNAEPDVADAKIRHAPLHRDGVATGYDRDLDATVQQHLDALTVATMEGFDFIAVVAEVQTPIGQDAVYIEDRQLNPGGPAQDVVHGGFRQSGFRGRRRGANHACSGRRPAFRRSLPPAGR